MQKSLLAGLSDIDLSILKKPVAPSQRQNQVPPKPEASVASHSEPATTAAVQFKPAAPVPAAVQPEPVAPAPVATQPKPGPVGASIRPEPSATASSAVLLPEGRPRRKAGRPRINPDRPLNSREKSVRYRQRHKALLAEAMSGTVNPAAMSHKDLCLAVARMLNQRDDPILRQTGYPMVKELQRRLKNL